MADAKPVGTIRVGIITKTSHGWHNPSLADFTQIIVKTKSDGSYWQLSPYYLKNSKNQIMENIWQSFKAYRTVSAQKQKLHPRSNVVIWEHPSEEHVTEDGELTEEYWQWRKKCVNSPYAIRYPNGFNGRHECLFSLWYNKKTEEWERLDYIEARKKIYCSVYVAMAKRCPQFQELRQRYLNGENLLILDVDGPRYHEEYPYNQTEDGTIQIDEEIIVGLLNNPRFPFGHGFVLACMIMGKEKWLK